MIKFKSILALGLVSFFSMNAMAVDEKLTVTGSSTIAA